MYKRYLRLPEYPSQHSQITSCVWESKAQLSANECPDSVVPGHGHLRHGKSTPILGSP